MPIDSSKLASFGIQKAEKKASMLRAIMYGVDGSGKTYSALQLARYLVGDDADIVVVDTELVGPDAPRSGQYDHFNHLVMPMSRNDLLGISDQHPKGNVQSHRTCLQRFADGIHAALHSGAECVIIDSYSDEKDLYMAQAEATGDNKRYYKDTKPIRLELIDAIKNAPCHVILCERSREQGVFSESSNGKGRIERMALEPIENNDIGYAVNLRIAMEGGYARITKSVYDMIPQESQYPLVEGDETLYELIASSLDDGVKTKALFMNDLRKRDIQPQDMRQLWSVVDGLGEYLPSKHDEYLVLIDAHLSEPVPEAGD